jgi:hypothetical protein
MVITYAAALIVVAALAAILSSDSKVPKMQAPDLADSSPRVVVKQPTRMRRCEPRQVARTHVWPRVKGQAEGKREPKASTTTHKLDESEPMVEPELVPEAAPVSPVLTSSGAEFGM